jgi:GAF domain-containing protein
METFRTLFHRNVISNKIQDFLFEEAGSPYGFLRVVQWFRFGIFTCLMVNFGLLAQDSLLHNLLRELILIILLVYFGFILFLLAIAYFNRTAFVSRKIQAIQTATDTVTILTLYLLSGIPESPLFLLLFLPLLVLARFYDLRSILFFMYCVAAITLLGWIIQLDVEQVFSFRFWFQRLLPQFGFLLIIIFFYLIYYRRRGLEDYLQKSAQNLIDGLQQLRTGVFIVDKSLRIVWADTQIRERHKLSELPSSCSDIFCGFGHGSGNCTQCPIASVFQHWEALNEYEATFMDGEGVRYTAGLKVSPQKDQDGNMTSAVISVADLDLRKDYELRLRSYVDNFERVLDKRRGQERDQLNTLTRQLRGLTEALDTLPSSDIELAIKEVILAATRQLNAQVVILSRPTLDAKSSQMGLQIAFYSGLPSADARRMAFLPLESHSLAVKAFKSGESQIMEDLTNSSHPYFLAELRKNSLHAQASFPLKKEGQTIGVISLFRKLAGGFSKDEMELGQAFANMIAFMIASRDAMNENFYQTRERQRLLDTLDALGSSLTPDGRPQEIAQQVADFTSQALQAETAAIFLLNDKLLRRVAISQLDSEWFSDEHYQIGQGLTGLALVPIEDGSHRQPVVVNDVTHSSIVIREHLEIYRRKLPSGEVYHLAAVPINGHEGPIGVLRVVNKLTNQGRVEPMGFTEHDVEMMLAFASAVGILIENSLRMLKHRIMTEVAQGFTASLSYQEVLQKSLEQAVKLFDAELGFILIPREDTNLLGIEVATGKGAFRLRGENLPLGHGVAYEVFQGNESQLVIDADSDDRLESWVYRRTGLQIRSLLSVPIRSPNRVIGVLELGSEQSSAFTLANANLLSDLTQWIGIAISNALQYQAQVMRADFLSRMEKSLEKIGAASAKKLTMDAVADAGSELMNCEFAIVALFDSQLQEFHALPDSGFIGVTEEYVREFHFSIDRRAEQIIREGAVYTGQNDSSELESTFWRRLQESLRARAIIAAPLIVGTSLIGMLYAATTVERVWTKDQSTYFSILAKHSAIAIHNAELQELHQRRAQLLNLMHEISIAGQLTTDISLILNIILTAVTAEYGLRFNRALLLLYDKQKKELRGFTGIGQLNQYEAQRIWENLDHESHTIKGYIKDVLEKKSIPSHTALHYKASNLVIPINSASAEVFSRVMRTNRAELVDSRQNDILIHPDFFQLMQPLQFVVTPLIANEDAIGILVVDNKFSRAPIGDMERELLDSCASQAAAAVQRSQLHQRLEQKVKILSQLHQAVQSFSELASAQEALSRIAVATRNLLHAEIIQIIPYNAQDKRLLIEEAVSVGFQTPFPNDPHISEHGMTRRVLSGTDDMLVLERLENFSNLNSRFIKEFGVKSAVGSRLEYAGEIVGVLYVDYTVEHMVDEAEFDILRTLSKHAAVAIHNARLMEKNRSLAIQTERNRLREDLHDVLGKLQFKVSAEAESIYGRLKRKRDRALAIQSEELWRYARHIYEQLERILEDMADPTLVESGLPEAMRKLLIEEHIPLETMRVQGDFRPPPEVELMLYRIFQEAVTNILKHAQLPENELGLVEIQLDQTSPHTRLVVKDHGKGFMRKVLDDRRSSLGLSTMRARAKKINATINIDPKPGEGVSIEVVAPRTKKAIV